MLTRGQGQGKMKSYCLTGITFLFGKMQKVLEMHGGDGYTTM